MFWLLLTGCGTPDSPQELARKLSSEAGTPCEQMPLAGARTTCLVTRAASAGGRGDSVTVDQTCATLQGLWADECRFRAGEELGKAGHTDAALRQCAQAGDFARNCITHAAWGLPRQPGLRPDQPAGPAMAEFKGLIESAMDGAPPGVAPEAIDTLMARAWFNLYVGSGSADPTAAQDAEAFSAQARSAWAIEAMRLGPGGPQGLQIARACWEGSGPCPSGEPLPLERTLGRYTPPILPPSMERHPHVAGFGGSTRLLGPDAQVDLQVALIEGAFYRQDTGPELFVDALSSPVDEVRWTACKLLPRVQGWTEEIEGLDPTCLEYIGLSRRRGREPRSAAQTPPHPRGE
ncbi:MAG: hypothetical protein VX899_11650 [Myxococcota bacterium]|nr:hypothetical protein [Myxococcota bacterium]